MAVGLPLGPRYEHSALTIYYHFQLLVAIRSFWRVNGDHDSHPSAEWNSQKEIRLIPLRHGACEDRLRVANQQASFCPAAPGLPACASEWARTLVKYCLASHLAKPVMLTSTGHIFSSGSSAATSAWQPCIPYDASKWCFKIHMMLQNPYDALAS